MIFFFEHHGMIGTDFFRVHQIQIKSFQAHLHRAYELIFVNEGSLSLTVDQKNYCLQTGELAFIFCNQMHSFSTTEPSGVTVVLFSPELIGDFHTAYHDSVPVNNVITLAQPPNLNEFTSIYARKSILYGICDALLSNTALECPGNRSQVAVLQTIFAYVDNHFAEDCSLKSVALSLQYDYAYLSKLFSRLTGMCFTQYLNHYRISQACYLLCCGSHTVSDVAYLCGYATLRTFHRNFRQVVHCSPRAYRALHDGADLLGVTPNQSPS